MFDTICRQAYGNLFLGATVRQPVSTCKWHLPSKLHFESPSNISIEACYIMAMDGVSRSS